MSSRIALRRPIMVWLLGFCFLLAPVINTLLSLHLQGYTYWYSPAMWFWLLQNITGIDIFFYSLILVSGIALFFQSKTSWFVAMFVLVLVSLRGVLFPADQMVALKMEGWSLVLNSAVFVVLYFFRYPYLDKRDHLFEGVRPRYKVAIQAKIKAVDQEVVIDNLSSVGCHLVVPPEVYKPELKQELKVEFALANREQKPTPANLTLVVTYFDRTGFGGPFKGMSAAIKKAIRQHCLELGSRDDKT